MLDINNIRDHKEETKKSLLKRLKEGDFNLDEIIGLDDQRKQLLTKVEQLKAERNKNSKTKPTPEMIEKMKMVGEEIKSLDEQIKNVESQLKETVSALPNLLSEDVPVGKDESENKVIRQWGSVPKFSFEIKDHVRLGQDLDLIDNETASKVSGARFTYLKNELALLQFALIQHAFFVLTNPKIIKKIADSVKKGFSAKPFTLVIPPVMVKPDVFWKMARLEPKEERYYIPSDSVYLVGSAEHTLGPMHMDQVILEQDLPLRYVGYSTAFRREAGSYGKDTKGILRMHQFDKIEMESFSKPEDSIGEQNFFVAIQEYLLQSLKIPYQVVMICTGDMGGPDARQIDIECWMPGQNKYRETHTADLMTDYQARRLNTKLKRKNGKNEFVHMNDATVFAIGRTLIAILENYQQKDGSVKVPKVLQKYTGFKVIRR